MKKIDLKGKRVAVIGGGSFNMKFKDILRFADAVVCADRGYDYAVKAGAVPDAVIGDMDSAEEKVCAARLYVYPEKKDDTDGELAIRYAVDHGAAELILLGFTGTRLDHTVTDMVLMRYAALKGVSCVMIDSTNEIYYLIHELEIKGKPGDKISVIPLYSDLKGLRSEGLEYPLDGDTLYYGKSRGVSNVMTEKLCRISAAGGEGLVFKSRD